MNHIKVHTLNKEYNRYKRLGIWRNMSHWYPIQIVEKYKTHAFNKANTVIIVATELFCYSYCSLDHIEWYSSKSLLSWWKYTTLTCQTPSSSCQHKHVLCNKSVMAWNFYSFLQAKGSSQSFRQGYHLVRNHMPYNKIFVLRAYTKVCGSCGRLYNHERFARKAKITRWNSNADNC